MSEWREAIRPPFSNYDIVVYFGCGLFSLPLIFHYFIEPMGLRFPRFQFPIGIPFADTAISTLSLLFAVYLLGHIIANAASATIERSTDLAFGKISSAIIISTLVSTRNQAETIQGWIWRRLQAAFARGLRTRSFLRFLFFLPVLPILFTVFFLKWFDYFRTRVPPRVLAQVRKETLRRGYGRVALHTRWFKAVEHDVINNHSRATARMYNYLVISGLFRSLSFLFVMCAWAEVYYAAHVLIDQHHLIRPLLADVVSPITPLATIAAFNVIFAFALSAYVKFSRRYVEEALFAFVLAR